MRLCELLHACRVVHHRCWYFPWCLRIWLLISEITKFEWRIWRCKWETADFLLWIVQSNWNEIQKIEWKVRRRSREFVLHSLIQQKFASLKLKKNNSFFINKHVKKRFVLQVIKVCLLLHFLRSLIGVQ